MTLPLILHCGFARNSYLQLLKENLAGTWTIESMDATSGNLSALTATTITFYADGTCRLPEPDSLHYRLASWSLEANDMTLHIRCFSASDPFHGAFRVYFSNENGKPLRLKLTSLNIELRCTR